MEAPEKIYLSKTIYGTYQYQVPDPDDDSQVEYVRKETIPEKVCAAYCKVCKMPNCRSSECKWISDFKGHLEDNL